jgi:hypothetical protein
VLLAETDARFVLLGSGQTLYEQKLTRLARQHPERVFVEIGYDEPLAHQIEAGADLFLMPSRFEPCGLNQMYSLRYGTPPVVFKTGGLADTVVDANAATPGGWQRHRFRVRHAGRQGLPGRHPPRARPVSPARAVAAAAAIRDAPVVRLVGKRRPLSCTLFHMISAGATMPDEKPAAPCTVALKPLPTSSEAFAEDFERYQFYHLGRLQGSPPLYTYQALAWTLRDRLMSDWMNTYTGARPAGHAARLLPVAGVPDRPRAGQSRAQSGAGRR